MKKNIMKRILKIMFIVMLAFILVACKTEKGPLTATEEAIEYGLPEGNYIRVVYEFDEENSIEGIVRKGTNEFYVQGKLTDIPTIEDREGYYESWSSPYLNTLREDTKIFIIYTIQKFTITFKHNNQTVTSIKKEYGESIVESDLPEIEGDYGIKSKEWDIELPYTVKGNLVVLSEVEYLEFSETENAEFEELLEELFYAQLGTDPLSITFNLYHPENFYKEGVFNFDECFFEGYEFSEEGDAEVFENCRYYIEKLEEFADETLTKDQYLDKIVLLEEFNNTIRYDGLYYYGTLLGSYLGYQAQLPMTLAEYRFDNKKSIEDYLSYIEYTQEIFEEIVKFENEKAEEGMPLTDVIINRVIEQCDEYINADSENPNFLIPVVNNKIDKCDFLTDEEKEYYKDLNTSKVTENFVEAYTYLRNELEKMLGKEDEIELSNGKEYIGSYAQMEQGKKYYEIKLQEALGTTMTADEIYAYLNSLFSKNLNIYSKNQQLIEEYSLSNIMEKQNLTLDNLIPFFMEVIKEDFPELNVELQYSIGEVDESLQENSSPAMYFISPIDDNLTESIYINPSNKDLAKPSTYMFTTIAHEGYPGHLYQNVYMKNIETLPNVRKLMSRNSYAEGWATYVEHYILKYVIEDEKMSEIMLAYNSLTYLLIGMVDIGVNYYGWDYNAVYSFLTKYLQVDEEACRDIMYDVTEIPTNYLMYYFSCYQFMDLKANFKKLMGDDYSDKLFHTIVLDAGSVSFEVLEYCLTDYYIQNKAN